MQILTLSDFAGARGDTFDLAIGTATMPMTLIVTQPINAPALPGARREPFELRFQSSSPVVLPQQAYPFRHPSLGTIDIFIVPIARDAAGIVYQAIFN